MAAWKTDKKYIEKRREEDKELDRKLIDGIKAVYSSEEWKNFLNLNRNFRNFSVENKLLVYLQRPDATMVKTANTWKKEYGRYINKDERAIRIRSPRFIEEEHIDKLRGTAEDDGNLEQRADEKGMVKLHNPKMYFKYIAEFDISQTNGKELPPHQITCNIDQEVDQYEMVKAAVIAASPCPVSFSDQEKDPILKQARGYYRPYDDCIVVRDNMSEADTIRTITHEISHAMLHGKNMRVEGIETTDQYSVKSEKEIQAESSAYMICAHLGIDTECQTFGYVAKFAHVYDDEKENVKYLRKNLDTICKCANTVIDNIELELSRIYKDNRTLDQTAEEYNYDSAER